MIRSGSVKQVRKQLGEATRFRRVVHATHLDGDADELGGVLLASRHLALVVRVLALTTRLLQTLLFILGRPRLPVVVAGPEAISRWTRRSHGITSFRNSSIADSSACRGTNAIASS